MSFRPVEPKSFFRIWLDKIQEKFKEKTGYTHVNQDGNQSSTGNTTNQQPSAVVLATQAAAFSVLTVPVLLDCNRPPKRRTTDVKLKDLQLAKQALLLHPHTSSTEALKETKQVIKDFGLISITNYLVNTWLLVFMFCLVNLPAILLVN